MKSIKKLFHSALLAASLTTVAGGAFAENLLVNGSFEQPGCSQSCVLDTTDKTDFINGWTTFLSGAEYFRVSAFFINSGAADGLVVVDLPNSTYENGGGIQQNFNTVVGAKYRLTFNSGNVKTGGRTGDGKIQVKVAGESVTFDTPFATSSSVVWNTITYEFTAKTAQTTLSFSNEQDPLLHFAMIDNVIVEAL